MNEIELEKHRLNSKKFRASPNGKQYVKQYNKNYNLTNKERRKIINARPDIKLAKKLYSQRPETKQKEKDKRLEKKIRVFNHYSNYDIKCNCCGEKHIEFLAIDHINNDGAKHRKTSGCGNQMNNWLIKNNYPSGFQILCFNCNWNKHQDQEHLCVHQKELMEKVY